MCRLKYKFAAMFVRFICISYFACKFTLIYVNLQRDIPRFARKEADEVCIFS